ncbi:hypothetical protein [Sodalis sp. dw_96]|uniref:hypothetical protein n=1 Tax=Sodalis sp. dw_96 TaxID=2719794 RepID=UPI001BD21965|nr:hypothetical protein [Sodalis sp. dw_96]
MEKNTLFVMVFVFALAGCVRTAPVLNVSEPITAHHSADEVKAAILWAGIKHEWVMTPVAPGIIDGHLKQRDHMANIRITYSPTGYSINYVNSQNLMADKGQIHRNYNRWIQNLDHDIQLKLSSKQVN